jgi:replicative DNA helicase
MGDGTALRPVRRTNMHVAAPNIEFMAGVPDGEVHSLEAEEEYCAALIGDEYAIVATRQDVLPQEFDFAQPRAIVEAAHALLTSIPPQVVTRATLIVKLKELERWPQTVNERYLDYLDDKATSKVIRAAKDNAAIVRMYYQAREQASITQQAAEATLLEPHRVIEIGADAAERILKLHANTGRVGDDPSPRSIRERSTQRQEAGIPTGITWFDTHTGGLRRARLIGIQGQQKSRKTSLLANLLQQPLMNGHVVSIFEYDNTAEEIWRNGRNRSDAARLDADGDVATE